MTDLMLPTSVLEIELSGVPKDSNATFVSSALYDAIPPAVAATTTKVSATMMTLAHDQSKKHNTLLAGAKR